MRTSLVPMNLNTILGNHISTLCPHSIGDDDNANHCAHFVSHIMGYDVGTANCNNYTWADKQLESTGVSIRVDDIFNNSVINGYWSDKPRSLTECLVFVTIDSNITQTSNTYRMGQNSRKHIGIFTNGHIYHYGNTNDEIVCDTPSQFISKFSRAYGRGNKSVSFFYGRFL